MDEAPIKDLEVFREKLDVASVFMRQLERVHIAASHHDPTLFEENVWALLDILPTTYRNVIYDDREGEYNSDITRFQYDNFCGVQLGTQENPIMQENDYGTPYQVKRDKDGNIDWGDPNIVSPHLVIETVTNYQSLRRIILEEAENAGILWQPKGGGVVNVLPRVAKLLKTSKNVPRTPEYKRPRKRQ